jgi:hypothetical protein
MRVTRARVREGLPVPTRARAQAGTIALPVARVVRLARAREGRAVQARAGPAQLGLPVTRRALGCIAQFFVHDFRVTPKA